MIHDWNSLLFEHLVIFLAFLIIIIILDILIQYIKVPPFLKRIISNSTHPLYFDLMEGLNTIAEREKERERERERERNVLELKDILPLNTLCCAV